MLPFRFGQGRTSQWITGQRHDLAGAHAVAGTAAQGSDAAAQPARARHGLRGDGPLAQRVIAPFQCRSGAGSFPDIHWDGDPALAGDAGGHRRLRGNTSAWPGRARHAKAIACPIDARARQPLGGAFARSEPWRLGGSFGRGAGFAHDVPAESRRRLDGSVNAIPNAIPRDCPGADGA